MAQSVEQSLPIPEVRGLNPIIGKNLYWKDENKEKEAGKGPFLKKNIEIIIWLSDHTAHVGKG